MRTGRNRKNSLQRGIELFNEGRYFEAHEAWEELWLEARDPADKRFLQGLIMASGAFHHYRKRECPGATTLLSRSIAFLGPEANNHPEIGLPEFIKALGALRDEFSRCSFSMPMDDLPKIGRSATAR